MARGGLRAKTKTQNISNVCSENVENTAAVYDSKVTLY